MKGFTIIEFLIAVAVIGIVLALLYGAAHSPSRVTFGPNGFVETRCIDGLKYVVGEGGQARQVIGANGAGVGCHD